MNFIVVDALRDERRMIIYPNGQAKQPGSHAPKLRSGEGVGLEEQPHAPQRQRKPNPKLEINIHDIMLVKTFH